MPSVELTHEEIETLRAGFEIAFESRDDEELLDRGLSPSVVNTLGRKIEFAYIEGDAPSAAAGCLVLLASCCVSALLIALTFAAIRAII